MEKKLKITIIEPCNFIDTPIGGNLIFVKNLIQVFGNNLKLVGTTTDTEHQLGKWCNLRINGIDYEFFPVMRCVKAGKKGIIPERFRMYINLYKYKHKILNNCDPYLYIGTPETLAVFYNTKNYKILYFFHGLANPLSISKYTWARFLSPIFDKWILPKVAYAHKIFAAADNKSILELEQRSNGRIKSNKVIQFPTRINENIFKKLSYKDFRNELNISPDTKVIINCGRLGYFKGWGLMLDAFKLFTSEFPKSIFILIGEGEDEQKIINYSNHLRISDNIKMVGFQNSDIIVKYLNASDVFIMGSFNEGWSTTLVEAVSCGVPSVVTNFSSANDIIINGINGFVVEDRNPVNFYILMKKALDLNRAILPVEDTKRYWLSNMKDDLLKAII